MVYSPVTGHHAAGFEGELDEDMVHLAEAQAGLWLDNLPTEHSALTDRVDHLYVTGGRGLKLGKASDRGQSTSATPRPA